MKRIPGYTRLSSRDQDNGHTLQQHIERLKKAGATEIYFDIDSRSKDDRNDLNKILHLIETRQVEEAIFLRIDRMTDSPLLLEKAIRICLDSEVRVRGVDDAIDFSTVGGRLHARILVNLARAEVERLGERVRHGWAYLRERKVAMNPPFGYVKVNDRHELDHRPLLYLVEEKRELTTAAIARELVDLFLEKRSLRAAIRAMNERYGIQTFAHNNEPGQAQGGRVAQKMFRFSPGGFRNWLTNPVLQGHLPYLRHKGDRAQIHYDTHPDQRLITDEEAHRIEAILSHNHRVKGYGSTALKYPLSGLVYCGECRSSCYSMTGSRGKTTPGYNYYFQCKNWRVRSCSQKKVVRMEVVEAAVIENLIHRADAIATLAELPPSTVDSPELQALRSELSFYQSAPGTRAAAIIEDLKRQIEQHYKAQENQTVEQSTKRELLLQYFSNPIYWEHGLTDEEKRDIYRALVDRVIIRDGQVQHVILKV